MNAATRATIASLISAGEVERVPVDQAVVTNLLRQAGNHLRTAATGADAGDPEGAFQLAYDACRKTSLALVMATGLRPKGQSAHVTTFEAAGAIASNFGGGQIVTDAAQLRYVRHGAEPRRDGQRRRRRRCARDRRRADQDASASDRADNRGIQLISNRRRAQRSAAPSAPCNRPRCSKLPPATESR